MADDVLKSFLVALGFQVDEEKHKLFQRSIKLSTEEVEKLGLAIASVSAALAAGVQRIADQFTSLFYTSQLTGTTIQNLKDLQFAAGQVGTSSEAMTQALRQTQVLLQTPAGEAQIHAFTQYRGAINSAKDGLDVLLKRWHDLYTSGGLGPFLARQQAQILGFNFDALLPTIINLGRFNAAQADYDRRVKQIGIKQDDLGKKAVVFTNKMTTLWTELGLFAEKAVADWIGPMTGGIKAVNDEVTKLATEFSGLDQTTRKEIEAIAAIGGAYGGFKLLTGAIGGTARALGLIGPAAAAAKGSLAGVVGAAGAITAVITGIEWLDKTFAPHGAEKRDKFYQDHPGFRLPDPAELFGKLFHHESYQQSSGGPGGLFHPAAYTYGMDVGRGLAGDLQDWLHGSTFAPMVRILDDSGGAGALPGGVTEASYTFGGAGGGRAPLGPTGPLALGGTPPRFSDELAQRLYAHARSVGLDKEHALAMLGNALAESSLDPNRVGDNGTFFGLFQWHLGRREEMMRALGSQFRDPVAQLDFAIVEQIKRDPGFFKCQGSVGDLTNDFERSFEKPSVLTDRGGFSGAISRALGAIDSAKLGGDVHHHHGDQNVNINAPLNVNVSGAIDASAASVLRKSHDRVLANAVRYLAPRLA